MGEHDVKDELAEGAHLRTFMRSLLNDLRALEQILDTGMIESGVRRIGAEQEMFLVDRHWRPACISGAMLEAIDDPHFTTELAQFNLELNLDPQPWGGSCLRTMEGQLDQLLAKARAAAHGMDAEIVLSGILPTIRKSDLTLAQMTPKPRYYALNRAINRLRGSDYEFRIKGIDELNVRHDSVMVESCNASFQVHFQVAADEFARLYNISQVAAAPILAAATYSPLLFGKRLWRETRIALFQQAVDTRSSKHHMREMSPRVDFGRGWVEKSVVELFQSDIARFKALLGTQVDEDPLEALARGEIPKLGALMLFNGTVWRWNRQCYGITNGIPHLRIENRILPSGPTPIDEMANAAFWFGLIAAMASETEDIRSKIAFGDVKNNFLDAARSGLNAQFTWLNGQAYPARELIVMTLLPMAREGLKLSHIDSADIDRYLGVIEERVASGKSGSEWILRSLDGQQGGMAGERLNSLVAGMASRQFSEQPVHAWEPAELSEGGGWTSNHIRVEQYMTTELITVHEDEPVDLVASLMDWEKIRHIPVEDHDHRLVGLVSYRRLLRYLGRGGLPEQDGQPIAVSEIMKRELITVAPETPTLEAIELMQAHKISALPVVNEGHLIGIVTERDFMDIAAELLKQQLSDS